jgi:hypothetical protein
MGSPVLLSLAAEVGDLRHQTLAAIGVRLMQTEMGGVAEGPVEDRTHTSSAISSDE